ncbi:MAG TPA: hypothetical protein VLC09_11550 [Polyangiaceae bacterium]|nr:hypothetical protein [Polyangiaceae bacterium]
MNRVLGAVRRTNRPHSLRWLVVAVGVALLTLLALGCSRSGRGGTGLLAGRTPIRVVGVSAPERLNDGLVPPDGSAWNSNRVAILSGRTSTVDWDLGEPTPVAAAALLGDNNDRYLLSGSSDGQNFTPLWEARSVRGPGVQWREGNVQSSGPVRFVRLQVMPADSGASVAEVVLVRERPAVWPPKLREVPAVEGGLAYRNALVLLVGALAVAVLLASPTAPLGLLVALGVLVGLGLYQYLQTLGQTHPLGAVEVSLTRASAAALGLVVVVREAFGPRKYPSHRWFDVGTLSLGAVLAVASFFNMGQPQFYDQLNREPSIVHNYDMRVYFPVAKYFRELRYDGLYLASVATYAEEHGGLETPELRSTDIRDLRNHRMRPVRELHTELREVKARFSPERWAQLKQDMRYFWETMGPRAYLGSMADHGGNATPVWLTIAHLFFRSAPASNTVLIWAAALDPLLLLGFFVCVWRTFGVRTALVSLIVYGANDFYMFGSNWAGATLRNDWMIYLGLGACALRARRFHWAGALLAMSALIRAFPALALLALGFPVLFAAYDQYVRTRKLPSLRRLLEEQRWFLEVALGAAACVGLWYVASSLVLGFSAWPLWVKKIASFTDSPHVNHISLLTVISGSEGNQALVTRARMPVLAGVTALYVVLAAWASYRRPPHVAALLGISLVPVLMYPANYYMHFVFLLPLLVDEPLGIDAAWARRTSGRVWALLLGMCGVLYLTVKEQSLDIHFYNASAILLLTLLVVFIVLLPRDAEGEILYPRLGPSDETDG